jgi:hypothetical protein
VQVVGHPSSEEGGDGRYRCSIERCEDARGDAFGAVFHALTTTRLDHDRVNQLAVQHCATLEGGGGSPDTPPRRKHPDHRRSPTDASDSPTRPITRKFVRSKMVSSKDGAAADTVS